MYPWSPSLSPEGTFITPEYAVYSPSDDFDRLSSPDSVGSLPKGIARWGQYDMGGNVFEWLADAYEEQSVKGDPCADCADLDWSNPLRVVRGGAYLFNETYVLNSFRTSAPDSVGKAWFGLRCARDL